MKKISITKLAIIVLLFFIIGFASFFFISRTSIFTTTATEPIVTPTAYIKQSLDSTVDTSSWKIFTDKQLQFSIKYPQNVMQDPRQTVSGRIYALIFTDDKAKALPNKVTTLYIANTSKKGIDGFSAFRKGDCKSPCAISYKKVTWVNMNNVYGIENPLPNDINNYYFTDKNQSGYVINIYIGGNTDTKDAAVQAKLAIFGQIIKTLEFER